MKNCFKVIALFWLIIFFSCQESNLLDQYIKDGPIIYAAKLNKLETQSGYYRFRVNLYPNEDVNRSHCVIRYSIGSVKDSLMMAYVENNYDDESLCYYSVIDVSSFDVYGNVQIEAHNVDQFGYKSLTTDGSVFIYDTTYVSNLENSEISFLPNNEILFQNYYGVIGNLFSYEQADGNFSKEIFVTEDTCQLINAKEGGIILSKSRYLINETDLDTLSPNKYLETVIPVTQ